MKNRPLTILATLSLLLLVALLALWIRSRTVIDYLQWTDQRHFPGVVSSDGRIIYSYQFWPNGAGGNEPGLSAGSRPGHTPYWGHGIGEHSRYRFAGFEWSPAATARPQDSAIVSRFGSPRLGSYRCHIGSSASWTPFRLSHGFAVGAAAAGQTSPASAPPATKTSAPPRIAAPNAAPRQPLQC